MKDPMKYVERYCYKHPNFGIKNLMRYISLANVAFWLISIINPVLYSYMYFDAYAIMHGQIWRLVTFMFLPSQTNMLALIAIYFYYWIGNTLEEHWGSGQFTIYFFSGVILTVLCGMLVYFISGQSIMLSSQYIYLSMFFSFAVLFPNLQVLLFFIIPVKMKYLAYIDAAFFVIAFFTTRFPANLVPVVAVLNFLIFCGGELWRQRPRAASASAVNFRRESRKIRYERASKEYTHKCSVCGRTDTEYPALEFRYCSRCEGYHCFCQEHINNHVHFTQ